MKRRMPSCPTPQKVAYRRRSDAFGHAHQFARELITQHRRPEPIYGYECRAGHWHITRRAEWNGVPNELLWTAPAELIEWAVGEAE